MHKRVGAVLLGWYLLLPFRDDGKPIAGPPDPFPKWQRVGAYDSALGCELARQARIVRDRTVVMTAVCVMSDEPRRNSQPVPGSTGIRRDEPGELLDPSAGDQ
jgi:hypothetical protein